MSCHGICILSPKLEYNWTVIKGRINSSQKGHNAVPLNHFWKWRVETPNCKQKGSVVSGSYWIYWHSHICIRSGINVQFQFVFALDVARFSSSSSSCLTNEVYGNFSFSFSFRRANMLMSYEIESDKFAEVLKHVRASFLEVNTLTTLPLVQSLRRNWGISKIFLLLRVKRVCEQCVCRLNGWRGLIGIGFRPRLLYIKLK